MISSMTLLQAMADSTAEGGVLFASEKIYTVLAVVLVVFGVLIYTLVSNDRKASRLEQEMDQLEK
ncbi:CcmD family protein [Pontibacter sp. G13]|uniref:CcmD family protein n=1 Tax=Pontibacter sp. G13 TaxID=3074898 RepID=UPI0028893ED1|nr:hypothetical protein [Pontibacter sp. G13]WNJ17433.1 hypothetical protein RJD25_21505 [Pontibacter sp. G13]